MAFIEFLEMMARIADIYSALSPGEEEVQTSSIFINDTHIYYLKIEAPQIRKKRHLSLKLEGFIHILYHRIAENNTKDTYILPSKSIFSQDDEDIMSCKKKVGKKKYIYRVDPVLFYLDQGGHVEL